MKILMIKSAFAAALAFCATSVHAQDNFIFGNDSVQLSGGVGVLAVEGNAYVYNRTGSQNVLSRLTWQSVSPMLTTGLDVKLPEGWTLGAEAQVGLSGNSYMEDFDWQGGSFAENDWSDRSQHDNVNLDWYFNGSMKVGHDFKMDEGMTVNLNAGMKYIDVQWSGFGGTYLYSSKTGFRDTPGSFAPGQAVITYRQQLPAVFLGVDTEIVSDALTLDFGAKAGVTINPSERDDHWLRDIVFADANKLSPMDSVSARAQYAVADNLNVFIGGTVDKVFTARGDTTISGAFNRFNPDTNGVDLLAASLSLGLKGKF